jgi:hypothetical protein
MVDDCCCSGIVNPCPPKSQIIPGVNNYAPHLVPNKYIHCDFNGHAFVRTCSQGSIWKQDMMSCLSLETVKGIEAQRAYEIKSEAEDKMNMVGRFAPKEVSMGSSSSYGSSAPISVPQMPPKQPTYDSYAPVAPAPAPQMPPRQPTFVPAPAPAPVPQMPPRQPTYESYAPVAPTPAPQMPPRQPSFVPTPAPQMPPRQPTYASSAPQMPPRQPSFVPVQQPPKQQQQQSYDSYAPQMLSYRSYYTPY